MPYEKSLMPTWGSVLAVSERMRTRHCKACPSKKSGIPLDHVLVAVGQRETPPPSTYK